MNTQAEERKAEILAHIAGRLNERLPAEDAALAGRFAELFYRDVAAVDLLEHDPQDLYGAVLALFRFGEERQPGNAKLRAYSPKLDQHGWQSTHTIIEIVNDDMPFLVDSVGMELARQGLGVHLVIHPVLGATRDAGGRLTGLGAAGEGERESFMHVEIDRQSEPAVLSGIERDLGRVLADVRLAVGDWAAIRERIEPALLELKAGGAVLPAGTLAEAEAFLRWLADDHFTLLGYGAYALEEEAGNLGLRRVEGTALGILRGKEAGGRSASFAAMPPQARLRAREPEPPVTIAKSNTRSTVHRAGYLDFIGVKRFGEGGKVVGEHRFLGLFTSAAYSLSPAAIPILRRKVEHIVARAGFARAGHAQKALLHTLETYPRDELFQTNVDELYPIVSGILQLQDRQRLKLFLRPDPFGRSISALVYVPRDRYNTTIRERMERLLVEATGASDCEFQAQLAESSLARILFSLRTPDGMPEGLDAAELERRLVEVSQGWSDRLRAALLETRGEEEANRLMGAYGRTMPVSYQAEVEPRLAVPDILELDRLAKDSGDLSLGLYRRLEDPGSLLHLKLIRRGAPVLLSDALPLLENMGFKVLSEQPHEIRTRAGEVFHLHDFSLRLLGGEGIDVDAVRGSVVDAFSRLWAGGIENDGFNRLVLTAGLDARAVLILRAYCKYLLQTGTPFSQAYIQGTLNANPALAGLLARLFLARFDPALEDRAARVEAIEAEISSGLDAVQSLDEDRILRRYLALIRATLRTNHFQPTAEGGEKPYLALKFASGQVPELPLPRPLFEIFVYAPAFEAIHLRGGKVARGGIRWSDRREDFRTEVLGLMKAQMVKNSVIVPVGAKGGFVLKRPPASGDRAALQEEAVRCYRLFLGGLLDLTDNRVGEAIVPPVDVVRYDEDDPYLVVAADKGTATFSDYANAVSVSRGFWLGDAFASGGSAGYDHKKMGITARGAWESVKRHFRELGLDSQSEPFTVVGIGDMSGDVFGNGMLLSEEIRLVAAFDHRHIVVDPDPDPGLSFKERQRLFELPRSSWADYDAAKLSAGGAIFPRTLKRLSLSPQAQAVLGLEQAELTPLELLSGILKAPVDLFWNGGIGTYVKAAAESQADAQDRGNDAIRVDAEELRCKVVGEGGNLGFTQPGRIAFALKGGRINTDFIDNSAGVDCSDHEVNIKILTEAVTASGDLTRKQRDELLAGMTDEVAELVLRDNVLQNLALSMSEALGAGYLDAQMTFMGKLERSGRLNRAVELLPDDGLLRERRQAGGRLTRPEIAVLLAYAKMTLYDDLLATDLPDRPYLAREIGKYFPRELRRRFAPEIERHGLRREIVATWLANSIVNRGLEAFVSELEDETGCGLAEITIGYVIARDAFALLPLWSAIEDLPRGVSGETQIRLLLAIREVLARGTRWFLAHGARPLKITEEVERFQPRLARLMGGLDRLLAPGQARLLDVAAAACDAAGVPPELGRTLAGLPHLSAACDIIAVALGAGMDGELEQVARTHFALAELLDLAWIEQAIERAPRRSGWERLALTQLSDQLAETLRMLTGKALEALGAGDDPAAKVAAWVQDGLPGMSRYQGVLTELKANGEVDLAMLSVAVRTLDGLLRGR